MNRIWIERKLLAGISLAFLVFITPPLLLRSDGANVGRPFVPSEVRGSEQPVHLRMPTDSALPRTIRVPLGNPNTRITTEPLKAPETSQAIVESQLRLVASHFSINADQFVSVARCESGLRADAVGDHGLAVGVLQFHERTFRANAIRYFGYAVGDLRHDVIASAVVAAWMIQRGNAAAWTCARTLGYA